MRASKDTLADFEVAKLTRRQRQVFELLGHGMENDAIADRLGMAPNTLAAHYWDMIKRLRLRSTHELRYHAIRRTLHDEREAKHMELVQ